MTTKVTCGESNFTEFLSRISFVPIFFPEFWLLGVGKQTKGKKGTTV